MKLSKTRKKTEIEELKEEFPDYDKTELEAEYDINGNVISIETKDPDLIKLLKSKGYLGI